MAQKNIVIRLRDNGCMQNAFLVGEYLMENFPGLKVYVYIDKGSKAEELFDGSIPQIAEIPADSVVLSGLPRGEGFDVIQTADAHRLVLFADNASEPAGERLKSWLQAERQPDVVCTLTQEFADMMPEGPYSKVATGFPVLDTLSSSNTEKNRSIASIESPALVSLPADYNAALHMIKLIKSSLLPAFNTLLFSAHPRLGAGNPQQLETVASALDEMSTLSTAEVRRMGGVDALLPSMTNGTFIGSHDTSLTWQSAILGVDTLVVAPPGVDAISWGKQSPLVRGGYANLLLEKLPDEKSKQFDTDGTAVQKIAKLLL